MRIVITAGPTREFIDPVRFISNRSSGRMGYALAAEAVERGHDTVLISGPVSLAAPPHARVVSVVSAEEMLSAVREHIPGCDALVMAAAVADWRPASRHPRKLKKGRMASELPLEPTPDILKDIQPLKGRRLYVGFAAETHELLDEARRKRVEKGLDLIVANDVSQQDAGFDVDTNRVTLVAADGAPVELPLMSKRAVAVRILDWIGTHAPAGVAAGRKTVENLADLAPTERLARQLRFICEIDKLKSINRRTLLMDGSRYENDAEHSWHLAMMAPLLAEHANVKGLDMGRVVRMVLVHDLVEIDAGDTYCYDDAGQHDKGDREKRAADRLFAMLPGDQGREIRALWEEFEERESPEARFAAALDRLQPLMHNYGTGGVVWRNHGVRCAKVEDRNRHVGDGSRLLWEFAVSLIRDAVGRKYLDP